MVCLRESWHVCHVFGWERRVERWAGARVGDERARSVVGGEQQRSRSVSRVWEAAGSAKMVGARGGCRRPSERCETEGKGSRRGCVGARVYKEGRVREVVSGESSRRETSPRREPSV